MRKRNTSSSTPLRHEAYTSRKHDVDPRLFDKPLNPVGYGEMLVEAALDLTGEVALTAVEETDVHVVAAVFVLVGFALGKRQ